MDEILDLKNWYIQKFEHLEKNLNGDLSTEVLLCAVTSEAIYRITYNYYRL